MKCSEKRNNICVAHAHEISRSSTDVASKIVKNVHNILTELEDSLAKSHDYERQLFNGKHSCRSNKENGSSRGITAGNCAQLDQFDTLQKKYEQLSEKYFNLLKSHESRCKDLEEMKESLKELQTTFQTMLKELNRANRVIKELCTKYMALKKSKGRNNSVLEKEVARLRKSKHLLLKEMDDSRMMLNDVIDQKLAGEGNSVKAQLLIEIKRSSHLQQENIKLKRELAGAVEGRQSLGCLSKTK